MLDSHVRRIIDWPLPDTGKKLQQFLGFINYYSSFIHEYEMLVAEMNSMRNIKGPLEWTYKLKNNFEKLKKAFEKSPTHVYPVYSKEASPFILDTDFSAAYPSLKGKLLAIVVGIKKV